MDFNAAPVVASLDGDFLSAPRLIRPEDYESPALPLSYAPSVSTDARLYNWQRVESRCNRSLGVLHPRRSAAVSGGADPPCDHLFFCCSSPPSSGPIKAMEKLMEIGDRAQSARIERDRMRFNENFERADLAIRQIDRRMAARRRSLVENG